MIKNELGVIIYLKQLGDSNALVRVLSESGLIISGFVKSANSKKNSSIYQISNFVSFSWAGREGSLGLISASCLKSYSSILMMNRAAILCINSACFLIYSLIKSDSHEILYSELLKLLIFCKENYNKDEDILKQYLIFENILISETGESLMQSDVDSDIKNNNYILLQNIFLSYNSTLPTCRALLQNYIFEHLT